MPPRASPAPPAAVSFSQFLRLTLESMETAGFKACATDEAL